MQKPPENGQPPLQPQKPTTEPTWSIDRVRSTFLEFYKERNHALVPSSSVVPHEDPTLLFANAGMNQFKPLFLGTADPSTPLGKLKRAANTQKCIRAGGKHNDLDDVGKDTYHHTFFEMLGNWSFGDYFKEESIAWAWELLTKVYGLDPNRIYVTYFKGEKGIECDEEARQIWLRYLPAERVLPFGMKENFWEMGETGPCGPCSEIHYDRLGNRNAGPLVNRDDPTVIEIWNHVFIQFNREPNGELKRLPAKHVDTGLGLERLTSILQQRMSNYDADTFTYLFDEIQRVTGARPYQGRLGADDPDRIDMAYRVIADHIRTLTMAVNDGAQPGATGRNYVVKRILRRAVYYGHQMLKAPAGFFARLVPTVARRMAPAFPADHLETNVARIQEVLRREEELFLRTLDRGIQKFNRTAEKLLAEKLAVLSGEKAFVLYATYGFPVDLTEIMAETRGLRVDRVQFEQCMKQHADISDAAERAAGGLELDANRIDALRKLGVPPTDDAAKYQYSEQGVVPACEATLRAIFNGEHFVERYEAHRVPVGLLFDRTCFYAEMGGQIYDQGHATTPAAEETPLKLDVQQVRVFGGFVLHVAVLKRGVLHVGQRLQLHVDAARRLPVMQNHTATHLLNWALRTVLQRDAAQAGSLVLPDRLRFDFAHDAALTPEQLARIDALLAESIARDDVVHTAELEQAVALQKLRAAGLRLLEGEAYPSPVRVVAVGRAVEQLLAAPDDPANRQHSIEFCGGTHLRRTGAIGHFALTEQLAVAAGVRRVVAVTAEPARLALVRGERLLAAVRDAEQRCGGVVELAQRGGGGGGGAAREQLQSEFAAVDARLLQLVQELGEKDPPLPAAARLEADARVRALRQRLTPVLKLLSRGSAQVAAEFAEQLIAQLGAKPQQRCVVARVEVQAEENALRNAVLTVAQRCPTVALLLYSVEPNEKLKKVICAAAVPKEQCGVLKAGEWVKELASRCGGKGGGKPEQATAYGTELSKLDEAIKAVEAFAAEKLGKQ